MAVHQPSLPGLSFISLAFPAVPAGLFSAAPDGALSSPRSGDAYIKLLSLHSPLVQNVFPPSLKSCPDNTTSHHDTFQSGHPSTTASSVPNPPGVRSLLELRIVSLKHALLHRHLRVPSLGAKRRLSDFRDKGNQVHVSRERQPAGFNVRGITEIQPKRGYWHVASRLQFGQRRFCADRRKNESTASQTVARRRGPGPCRVWTSAHSDRCRCRDRHHLVQGSDCQRLRLSNQRTERFLIAALHAEPQPPAGVSLAEASALTFNPLGESMNKLIRLMWSDDEGQDLAEYGLLLILIAVAVVTGITLFKDQIVNAFASATSVLSGA